MVVDNVKGNVAEGQSLDQYITMSTTLFHEFLHVAVDNSKCFAHYVYGRSAPTLNLPS